MKLKVTYFKKSGKFYCSHEEYISECFSDEGRVYQLLSDWCGKIRSGEERPGLAKVDGPNEFYALVRISWGDGTPEGASLRQLVIPEGVKDED